MAAEKPRECFHQLEAILTLRRIFSPTWLDIPAVANPYFTAGAFSSLDNLAVQLILIPQGGTSYQAPGSTNTEVGRGRVREGEGERPAAGDDFTPRRSAPKYAGLPMASVRGRIAA